MRADFELKDYYNIYINNAKNDIIKNKEKITECVKQRNLLYYKLVNVYKDIIVDKIHLNLMDYKEIRDKVYDEENKLFNLVKKLLNADVYNKEERFVLLAILRYVTILKKENEYKKKIEIANNRTKISFKEYHKIVKNYYMQVHKNVLEGKGYKFEKGLGILVINYWKTQFKPKLKVKIDFDKTNKNRRELINRGLRPYKVEEAREYERQGKKYDGVEYKVLRNDENFFEITITNGYIFPQKTMEFQREEYIHAKLRGLSFQQMALKYCKNLDDIVKLPVDIRVKLNILNFLFPNSYLNFIRNAERQKYKYRKNYCKD